MKRLWFLAPGKVEWREASEPTIEQPHEAIVRPIASTTCDLDVMFLRGEAPFPGPIAFGHEAIGEIVARGEGVGLPIGQRVVLPWHLSCGGCDRCRRRLPNTCRSYPQGAMYGLQLSGDYGSFFADAVKIPHAGEMLVPLPPGLDPVACASASDNLPFAYEFTIPHLKEAPGADVLVMGGCGSVGLYAAAFAVAGGARETTYVDTDRDRLERAARYGAKVVEAPPPRRMPHTYPITIDASANAESFACAIRSTEPEGMCSSVGCHWSDVSIPAREMYSKGFRFYTGRGKGQPHVADALAFVSAGRIDPAIAITEVVPFDDGDRALANPSMKVVLSRVAA